MSIPIVKIQEAIDNNIGLYQSILRCHDNEWQTTPEIAFSLEQTPPLYSNLVTRSPDWLPNDIFRAIDSNYIEQGWKKWSLKDSFGILDLSRYGFERLFDARWIYLPVDKFRAIRSTEVHYEIVRTDAGLSAWVLAWGQTETITTQIFCGQLLADPNIAFIAGYTDEGVLKSGCIINRTDDMLGISNTFGLNDTDIRGWTEMIDFVLENLGPRDLVGYERKNTIANLTSIGFESIGDLTVWLKHRN